MAEEENAEEDGGLPQKPPKEEECVQQIAPWMATFADLVTLLMCFFVLLFAMSTTQEETFKELIESLRSALGVQEVPETGTREALTMVQRPAEKKDIAVDEMGGMIQKELDDIVSDVKELVKFNTLQGMVNVKETDDGAVITISDVALFSSGKAVLSDKGFKIMKKVAKVLKQFPYPVKVAGHTDNRPISTAKFSSNWGLSAVRASNVVRFLIDHKLDPENLSAQGFAHYRPITTNDTVKGRSKNRRVEIIYERNAIEEQLERKQNRRRKKN